MKPHISEIISDRKPGNDCSCPKTERLNNSSIMSGKYYPWHTLTVGERLRVLRQFAGKDSQQGMAVEIGEPPESDSYGKAERTGNLSKRMNDKIHARWPQLDAGWPWWGIIGHTPDPMEKALYEALKALELFDEVNRRS
jgi:hypothetical protein